MTKIKIFLYGENLNLKHYYQYSNIEYMSKVFDFIVAKAMEYKLGARGLRSICESLFNHAMFELPGTNTNSLHIDMTYANKMFSQSKLNTLKVA